MPLLGRPRWPSPRLEALGFLEKRGLEVGSGLMPAETGVPLAEILLAQDAGPGEKGTKRIFILFFCLAYKRTLAVAVIDPLYPPAPPGLRPGSWLCN